MKNKRGVTFSCLLGSGSIFGRPKKAWIRVFEAVLAILLVTSVVLILYSRQTNTDSSEYYHTWGDRMLNDISYNDSLRAAVFLGDNDTISSFILSQLPISMGFEIQICNLNVSEYCRLQQVINSDIYVSERIFGSNIIDYSPKRVKLFLWENDN